MSGYLREEMSSKENRDIGFLQKPFTPSELLETVAALLGRSAFARGPAS